MNQDLYNHGIVQPGIQPLVADVWTRDPDWLAMPTVLDTENKIVMLVRVDPGISNFVTAQCSTSAGTYTIDWGDGTNGTFTSGVQANKQFDFDVVTSTITSKGYKTALVTITPTVGGAYFSSIILGNVHNQAGLIQGSVSCLLDLIISAPSATTLSVGSGTVNHYNLERVQVLSSNSTSTMTTFGSMRNLRVAYLRTSAANSITAMSNAFVNDFNLVYVDIPTSFSSCTNVQSMFSGCAKLSYIPDFSLSTTAATMSTITMFNGCASLRSAPKITIPTSVTTTSFTASSMFAGCTNLVFFPDYDFSRVTSAASMFNGCGRLTMLPAFNLSRATTIASMFATCTRLTSVGTITTSAALLDTSSMFNACTGLANFPTITDTSAVTNMASMYSSCYSLQSIPAMNTAAVTNMSGMFASCNQLIVAPTLNTAAVTNMSTMFQISLNLREVPSYNYNSCTTIANMFNGCRSLVEIGGPIVLSAAATTVTLTAAFTSCDSLRTVPTITISSNNTSVLLNSLFNNSVSIQNVPSLNAAAVASTANISSVVAGCTGLKSLQLTGLRFGTITVRGQLSAPALIALFESLGTASGAQTLTVSANWGWASLTAADKLIATNKGWTLA